MKMYTAPEQTTKLIGLGFEKPRYYCADKYTIIYTGFEIINYSIGELIEMLPQEFKNASGNYLSLSIHTGGLGTWDIQYLGFEARIRTCEFELIDAVFDMLIILKEEGVI